jgi:hypothetical protein
MHFTKSETERKRQHGKTKHRWGGDIKVGLKEIRWEGQVADTSLTLAQNVFERKFRREGYQSF